MVVAAGTNWLAFAATLAVSFFLTPYLIAKLGTARYDAWCVAESVLAYFTLLDMGLAACLVRYVARHHASDDRDALNRMASSCLALFAGAGVLAVAVGVPVVLAVSPGLERKAGSPGDVLPFMLVMMLNVAATLPLSVFPSVLDGLERFAAKSAVRVGFLAVRTVVVIRLMEGGAGLLPLAVVTAGCHLAEHAVFAVLCYRFLPGLRFSRRLVDRATLRDVRGYSVDAFLAMLAGRVTVQSGAVVAGVLLGAGQVTAFAVAARLVEYAKTLLRTVTSTLTPGVSGMEARGDWDGVRRLFLGATRAVLYLVLPVNLGLWFFGRPFLERWVPEVGAAAFPTLVLLALTLTVGVAQSVASRILYGLGRLRLFARLALAEAAVNLALSLALAGPFGVAGIAAAVAGPNVLFCVAVIAYAGRVIGVTGREYAAAWLRPLLAAGVAAGAWAAGGPTAATWPAIGAGIATGLVPYALAVAAMEVSPAAATRRLAATRRRVPRLSPR